MKDLELALRMLLHRKGYNMTAKKEILKPGFISHKEFEYGRKIEGYNIYSDHLLVTIFNEIKKVLEDIININLY